MPRSGTTWLGRLLAAASGTALVGREPMNPHPGQYRLAHTIDRWTELTTPTARQRRALRRVYRGLDPLVYGRYGRRQWAAALPGTRVVVKDPFAMLSLPTVGRLTGARVVLLFRHPGGALASYRRMGWQPDLDELRPVLAAHRARVGSTNAASPLLPAAVEASDATAMAAFWSALYEIALDNLSASAGEVEHLVVSHEELAGGGVDAARALFERLGLTWTAAAEALATSGGTDAKPGTPDANAPADRLHNFDRKPGEVAGAWRAALDAGEVDEVEQVSAATAARLDDMRWRILG